MINNNLQLIHDFSDNEIGFGDYIRLKNLKIGDLIYLKDQGIGIKVVLIGNGTEYEGIGNTSHDGWDWDKYNNFKVWLVYRLELPNACWLDF